MSSSLKQFATLISNFIENTLMPIINTKSIENSRIIDQWKQLRSLIHDTDTIQIWKIEKFILVSSSTSKSESIRQPSVDKLQKYSLNPSYKASPSQFDAKSWKYSRFSDATTALGTQKGQKRDTIVSSGFDSLDQGDCKQEKCEMNVQSFETMLISFRKLCTNFQNNHKKLIRDRQSMTF